MAVCFGSAAIVHSWLLTASCRLSYLTMPTKPMVLLGVVIIVLALIRTPGRSNAGWSQYLRGWQRLFGVVALVMALLIVLNPEFLALGLFSDTAFLDVLVLAMSLRMHMVAVRTCRWCVTVVASGMRRMGIPSPGLAYLLGIATVAIGGAASVLQRAVQRVLS